LRIELSTRNTTEAPSARPDEEGILEVVNDLIESRAKRNRNVPRMLVELEAALYEVGHRVERIEDVCYVNHHTIYFSAICDHITYDNDLHPSFESRWFGRVRSTGSANVGTAWKHLASKKDKVA